MQRIKLILFPYFIGELLENKTLTKDKLRCIKDLSTILSDYSVVKLLHLNSNHTPSDKANDLLVLNTLKSYAVNNDSCLEVDCKLPQSMVGNTLSALCKVGDEEMVSSLHKNLHNYALPFKNYRIAPKTYAIVFDQLMEVSSSHQRTDQHIKDMEGLIADISLELTDKELLEEDLYRNFLSLM